MSRYSEFAEFVIEQMAPIGRPQLRAMFGGYGVYKDDRIFAIIVGNKLYFKADSSTRRAFDAKGLRPFTYVSRGKSVVMEYLEAPPEVFEEPEAMRNWAQKAYGAALRAKKSKAGNKKNMGPGSRRRARDPGLAR